jgi:hypothetical protein
VCALANPAVPHDLASRVDPRGIGNGDASGNRVVEVGHGAAAVEEGMVRDIAWDLSTPHDLSGGVDT